MVFEYMTVQYQFFFVLTVIHSKAQGSQVQHFLASFWANWTATGFYLAPTKNKRKKGLANLVLVESIEGRKELLGLKGLEDPLQSPLGLTPPWHFLRGREVKRLHLLRWVVAVRNYSHSTYMCMCGYVCMCVCVHVKMCICENVYMYV
jgi:hypothetical protein